MKILENDKSIIGVLLSIVSFLYLFFILYFQFLFGYSEITVIRTIVAVVSLWLILGLPLLSFLFAISGITRKEKHSKILGLSTFILLIVYILSIFIRYGACC